MCGIEKNQKGGVKKNKKQKRSLYEYYVSNICVNKH